MQVTGLQTLFLSGTIKSLQRCGKYKPYISDIHEKNTACVFKLQKEDNISFQLHIFLTSNS